MNMPPDEEEILLAFTELMRAMRDNDKVLLGELLYPSYLFITWHGKTYNRASFIANVEQVPGCTVPSEAEIDSIETNGNVATLVTMLRGDFMVEGRWQHGVHATSHTMIKKEDKWFFLAGHIAKIWV